MMISEFKTHINICRGKDQTGQRILYTCAAFSNAYLCNILSEGILSLYDNLYRYRTCMCWEYKPTQFVKIMILKKLICCPDKIDIIIGYKNPEK